MRKSLGFTLIELVVVIAILAILATVAIPRFINLTTQANVAAVNGVAGALRSAVALSVAKWTANGSTGTTVTFADGTAVTVGSTTGIPAGSAAGIGAALTDTSTLTIDYTTATAVTVRTAGGSATCQAAYNGTTGVVTVTTSGC